MDPDRDRAGPADVPGPGDALRRNAQRPERHQHDDDGDDMQNTMKGRKESNK